MTPESLLECFHETADAVRDAVATLEGAGRRDRTERPGQYALDVVADEAALEVLRGAGVRVVSEESAETGADEPITVVIDPIDGSTNCARGIAYWCTSLCAIDADGAFVALVANHATGQRTSAVRGEGAFRDGVQLEASSTKIIEESVIALGGWPRVMLRAKQTRMLGSIALELCDVAAGGLDGHVDGGRYMAPWDYLGGLLVCREAGAVVLDARGEELVTDDHTARRQIVAAGTQELADALLAAIS